MLMAFPGIVIEGARQVGKSTLATQIAAPGAVTMNLDHAQTRAAAKADPEGFVLQAGDQQLVIDEIQRMPELTLAVKTAIDADRRPGKFILTGSSSLLHVRGTADSLAGRVGRLTLYGLSQDELRQEPKDFIGTAKDDPQILLATTSGFRRSDYAGSLATGSYPEARSLNPAMRNRWLDAYLAGIVGRDLPELRRQISPARSMALLRALAGRQSSELNKAKLATETSVPAGTITGYLDLLHNVGLVTSIPPWTPNIAKREIGRPKSLIIDSALAMRLARMTPDQIARIEYGETLGAMLEALVCAELLRQRTWSSCEYDLFHYRDLDGDEVDLVVELYDGTVIAIEVKASMSFTAKQFTGLLRMRDRLGDRFRAGIVLNTGTGGYRYAERLFGAPVSSLWTL